MEKNSDKCEIIAKTFSGLENLLAEELKQLGANEIVILKRGVKFKGSQLTLYKVNYYSRLALKILKHLYSFNAVNELKLYENIYNYPWEKLFSINQTFMITSTVNSANFKHSQYISLKVKDAIADRFRDKCAKRPYVERLNPDYTIHIHINSNNECHVSLDSSGEPLFKRGYRGSQGNAPLNEVLAAGLIQLTGWDKKCPIVDFMCGSGTILIEAALFALNIAPGKFRKLFAFQKWKDYDIDLFNSITKNKPLGIDCQPPIITGCDIDKKAIENAQKNINNAGLSNFVKIQLKNFTQFRPPKTKGIVISNPPYGERIKNDDINNLYKQIGDVLKNNYVNYDSWLISHNLQAFKHIGLKTGKKIILFNGPLECRFNKYSILTGSLKKNK